MASWHPRFALHVKLWPRIFSYSANVIGETLTSFIINEGDTLLIGKLMGIQALGIYNFAWQSANLVSRNINGVVYTLALPALSAVAEDLSQLKRGFIRMMRLLSITTFPLLIGLFVVADDFILAVYGQQWVEAILPLRILIIYALRYAVSPAGVVYKAIGRPDITFKLGLAIVPFYLGSIWVGSSYGIVGVAFGVTLVRTVFGFIGFKLVGRVLQTDFMGVIKPLGQPLLASFWMGGVVFLAKLMLNILLPESSSLFNLVTLVALGGLSYLVLLRTSYHGLAQDLGRITAPLLGPYQGAVNKVLKI